MFDVCIIHIYNTYICVARAYIKTYKNTDKQKVIRAV